MAETRVTQAAPRDLRLDAFRGLCLAMIFVNHVPATVFEKITSRNFGFSDAAEGFVMMSGIAAGLAYSTGFRGGLTWAAVAKVWRRAWTIYLVQAMLAMTALGILSWGAAHMGALELLRRNDFGTFLSRPLGAHIGLPLLTYQIGYVNILPMYIVLLLAAPAMLWAGHRWPLRVWAASAALWFAAGFWGLNLPNYPLQGGWFFNPISWQFLFCTGLLTGMAMKSGRRFLPIRPWAQIVTAALLLAALLAARNREVSILLGEGLWRLQEAGVPRIFTTFDKTFLTAPRLFHILALTYLLSTLTLVTRWSASPWAAPFVVLGRHALAIFALGSLLALIAQVIKFGQPPSFALDCALVMGGLALQLGLAMALDMGKPSTKG